MKKLLHILILAIILCIYPTVAFAERGQQIELLASGLIDNSGCLLDSGLVYTYEPGTTTEKTTYTDIRLTTPATNPIVLDSTGKALVYGSGGYKLVVKTSAGAIVQTLDSVWLSDQAEFYANATVSGSGDAVIMNLSPTLAEYSTGMVVIWEVAYDNTTAADVNIDNNGSQNIKKKEEGVSVELVAGDLKAGDVVQMYYNGVDFILQDPNVLYEGSIGVGAVTTTEILDGTIASIDIATDAVTADEIAASAVGTSEINDGTVDTADLAADCITEAKIADDAVQSEHIGTGEVNSGHIATDGVDSAEIAANAVGSSEIATDAVGSAELDMGAGLEDDGTGQVRVDVDDTTIARGASGLYVKNSGIGSTQINDNSIETGDIKDGTITGADIQNESITGSDIDDGTILNADIGDDQINSEHYAAGSIDNEHIADDQINSEHYAAGSIDLEHMAANSIDSAQYVNGSIDNEHYADGSIDTNELANGAVTTAKVDFTWGGITPTVYYASGNSIYAGQPEQRYVRYMTLGKLLIIDFFIYDSTPNYFSCGEYGLRLDGISISGTPTYIPTTMGTWINFAGGYAGDPASCSYAATSDRIYCYYTPWNTALPCSKISGVSGTIIAVLN